MAKKTAPYELCLLEGIMGSGKSTTAVALCADAVKNNPGTRVFGLNINMELPGFEMITMSKLAEYMNTDKFTNAYIVVDEAYIGADARNSMSAFNKVFSWFIQQSRKRKLTMIVIAQNTRFLDHCIRTSATTHIICKYIKSSDGVKVHIRRYGEEKSKEFTYSARQYWKYFDTYELPKIPDIILAKAIASVGNE